MRIAFITPTLNVGGYEKVVIAYANELANRGHQVDILCGFKTGDLMTAVNDSVTVYDFQARARDFLSPLVKYLKREQPDILYCAFREYNCIGVMAKKLARVKTCIYATQHGFQENSKLIERLMGKIIKKADRLITVADGIADYESERLHIDRKRFITFDNPVLDTRKTIPDEYHPWFEETDRVPIIVMSGRISGDKGEKKGIDILAELNKQRAVRMIILGSGPALDEVKVYAAEKDVGEKVCFMGYVNNPLGYMKHCTLFLHTASMEGFGNVVVEALYCNLPVCVTNCSGPMQIIENGKYGVNLGAVSDECFVCTAVRRVLAVLNGEIHFEGLTERAECFEVQKAVDQLLRTWEK